MSRNTALAALVCASMLVGCAAGGPRTALKPELRQQVGNTQAYAGLKQNEIYAQIIPSTSGQAAAAGVAAIPGLGILLAGAAGAAGAAADASVNAARTKEQEGFVVPLRDGLTEFNFDDLMRQELDRTLAESGLGAQPIEIVKQVDDKHYKELFDKSTAGAVLFVNTDYSMSPDFSSVMVQTQALLFARSPELRKAAKLGMDAQSMKTAINATKAIYRNSYVSENKLQGAGTDKAQNIAAWQQEGRVRAALEQGVKEIVALLAMDLQAAPAPKATPAKAKKGAQSAPPADEIIVNGVRGQVIARNEKTTHVRFPDGTLRSQSETSTAVNTATQTSTTQTN